MNTPTATTIRKQKIETMNELIAVTRDSAEFYTEAATKVDNSGLKNLFTGMAHSKNGLVGAMSRDVRSEGAEPAKEGTFRGSMRKLYGDVRAKFGDQDYAYVSELEAGEDRLLHALKDVLDDDAVSAPVREAVTSYLPTVKQHHDEMRDRKWAMQARH
ncbi:MAG: PA2169 family four-helix-bundle protein [Pseudomonadota bacterium]|nr:PA2169 family four-helix-bundle protein [Pseudomonadota bacterium]